MMAKPPASFTSLVNLISVPRPAILVAMVTAPNKRVSVVISSVYSLFSSSLSCLAWRWADTLSVKAFPSLHTNTVPISLLPAAATMLASFWWSLAFSTWWGMWRISSIRLNNSLISTDVVPTKQGLPEVRISSTSSITAAYFSRAVLYTRSCKSWRSTGRLVGISTTSSL